MADYTSPDIARWTPPPREWRLPVMTSNLRADWAKAHEAHRHAVEPWQERACVLRIQQLAERQAAETARTRAVFDALADELGRAAARVGRQFALAFGLPEPGTLPAIPRPRPRPGHAGPQRTPRAPRTIGRPSTGRR